MTKYESLPSGAACATYNDVIPKSFELASGDEEHIAVISDHIKKHLGPINNVFHEIISDQVHVDVYLVKPTASIPYNILITSGMSDKPMNVPNGREELRFAELCILLPSDWPLDIESFNDENNYWPVRWLKQLARFPHEYDTFFCLEHTISGEENEPVSSNCSFCGFLFFTPMSLPKDFCNLKLENNDIIHFYCLIPLYKEEIELKNNKGLDELLKRFSQSGLTDVVNINRPNCCTKRKKLWGLW
ncbi:MAG: suppressor of fused domain protein [Planctomycetaceae bacterium]|jgi:hypothetical protein|nr:suppressor of fused domain protein [Planctomycetaceae bacterium]